MNRFSTLITAVAGLAERVGTALRWLSPTIARLTVGLVFFQSGWGKLHDLEKVTGYFTELGIPNPAFQARFASTAEFVCGGLLLLGLATRFAVVPLIVTMCVAIRTAQWENVDGIGSLLGLLEFSYIALLVWLGTDGPGPLSLDRLIARVAQHRTGETSSPLRNTSAATAAGESTPATRVGRAWPSGASRTWRGVG
jgi:putative oxidoreductase